MPRYIWVDNAKTILIFLVVLGHFHYIYGPVAGKNLIYAFHVPAFLFVTGFLVPIDFGGVSVRSLFKRWIGPYVRAYAFFSLIAIGIWWMGVIVAKREIFSPLPSIWGALYGVAGQQNGLVHQDQPLWYFPFLISAMLGAWAAAALSTHWGAVGGWIFVAIYAAIAFLYQGPRLPWDIDIAGIGSFMIFAGHQLRRHYIILSPYIESRATGPTVIILFILVLASVSEMNGATNINGAEFGANGFLFIIGAVSGSLATMAAAAQIPPTLLARVVSINTLTIFALHIYLVRLFAALPRPFGDNVTIQMALWMSAAMVVLLSLPLAWLLRPLLRRWVIRSATTPS